MEENTEATDPSKKFQKKHVDFASFHLNMIMSSIKVFLI